MATVFLFNKTQWMGTNGLPLNGGKISTFAADGITPLASYTDSTGATPAANPVVTDANGFAQLWLTANTYVLIVKTSAGATVETISGFNPGAAQNTVTSLTDTGDLTLQQSTAATSGANQSGNNLKIQGRYWTGAADATDTWNLQDVVGTGANPTSTLSLTHSGTSGVSGLSIPSAAVTLGGTVATKTLNNIRFADQFATLAAAVADVPAGGTLFIPPNTSLAVSSSITLSKNIYIIGLNRATSIITAPVGASIFTLSGTIQQFKLEGLTLIGNGAGSKVFDFTGVTASEGRLTVANNIISTFPAVPLTFGASNYLINIERNTFVNCSGSITLGNASDAYISDNFFENLGGSSANITVRDTDVHIFNNYFVRGSGTGTGPDILIDPIDVTGNNGYIWILNNKFGNDGGESASRYKIQVNNATASFVEGPVNIVGNNFFGASGQSCIRLDNQIKQFTIADNYFSAFGTSGFLIDDSFTVQNTAVQGQSQFYANRIAAADTTPLTRNGGRGFWRIDYPETASDVRNTLAHETPELRNRLLAPSEDMSNASWVKAGITITTGQTDPFGTTRANLLTRANAAANENVGTSFSNSGLGTHVTVRFWAKGGTATTLQVNVKDTTTGAVQQFPLFAINSSTWIPYKYDVYGLIPGDVFTISFYPNGTPQSAGTVLIFGVQVSDYDSDYIPVPASSMISDTTSGARLERNLRLGTSSKITEYRGITTVSAGIPSELATVDLTAQGAAITTTTLYAVPAAAAGQYRVVWDAKVTTADGVSSTLGALTIVYTDPDGVAQTITAPATIAAGTIATTSTGNTTTTVLIGLPLTLNANSSTNITYAFAYVSNTPGQMKYNLHIKLEAL